MLGPALQSRQQPVGSNISIRRQMTLSFLLRLGRACDNSSWHADASVPRRFARGGLRAASLKVAGEHAGFKQS
jgi:hypothetical protein